MKTYSLSALNTISANIREDIISMLLAAGSGHSAGPLGMADVFTALYFCVLNHAPRKPSWDNRDRLVLSCGHLAPLLYATLARAGYFPKKELKTLRKLGSLLQGHPHNTLPGVETSTGPLGQGISVAVGMSLGAALLKRSYQVYCVMSDAEQQEGQTWEAVMFAGKNRCANLTAIIDRNNIQIDGYVENVMPLEPLRKKYEAFNWHVIEVDGHNIRQVIDACHTAKAISEKPVLILCHTIPGKGVDFMEFSPAWHGKTPTAEEARRAHRELHRLRTLNGKIISEHE